MTKVRNGDIRMDDWLQHHEEDTNVEQKWDDIKYSRNSSRRKLREDKSYTKKDIFKDFG